MPFDPTQPFELLDAPPVFDPSKPFDVVDDSFDTQLTGAESKRPVLEAELDAVRASKPPTLAEQLGYAGMRATGAAAEVGANILQVPAIIGTRVVGGKQEEQPLYKIGEAIKRNVREKMEQRYPAGETKSELLKSNVFTEDVPAGVGSSLAFLAAGGPLGRLLGSARGGVAATGSLSQAGAQAEEARAYNASPNKEFIAALLGAGLGLTEAVGIGSVAARLDKASGGTFSKAVMGRLATAGKAAAKETVEEIFQEGVQSLGEDVIAKSLAGYDPSRELGKELWDRVQAGGISGFLLSSLASAAGGSRPPRNLEPTKDLKPGDVIPGTERKTDATTTRTAEEVLDTGATAARVPADGQDRANIAPVVAPRQPDSAGGRAPGAVGAVVPPQAAPGTVAPVVYRGYQEGFRNVPGYHLYNLTADLGPTLVKGSTVTEESLAKAGFTIPPAEKAKAIAPVEAPPAPPAPIVAPQPPPTQPTPQGPPPPKKPTTTSAPPADVTPVIQPGITPADAQDQKPDLAIIQSDRRSAAISVLGKPETTVIVSAKTPAELIRLLSVKYGLHATNKPDVFRATSAVSTPKAPPSPAKPKLRRGARRDPDWRYLDPTVVATSTKPAKPPKPPTIKQEFDKLALDYATIHEIQYDPIVTEDVATVPGGARSTHNAEKQRLRRVVFSALGLKGDTMDNADLSAALPKLKEAIAKREAELSVDETESDRAEFPADTNTGFLPTEETSTPAPAKPDLELAAPETVEQQKARQAAEETGATAKADKEKLAEGAAKPLVGKVGDIGQADLLGGGDLFSAPAPTAAPKGVLASLESSMTPEERAELAELEADLKKKLGRTNVGVDPTIVTTGGRIAILYAKAGVRQFKDFAARMLEKFGEAGRRYLLTWYNNARMQTGGEGWDNEAEAQRIYDTGYATESGRTVPEPTGGAGAKRSPIARVVRRELIPEPRAYVRTDSYAAKSGFTLDAEQTLGANQILTHFLDRNGPAFLLADNPGFGKTAQNLVVADQFIKARPGARVLYVTQNDAMIKGTITSDSSRTGINLGQFEIATYSSLHTLSRRDYDLVIFDESHNLKNGEARKSMAAARIKSPHKLFATATPMDRPSGAAYFLAEITGKDEIVVAAELGYTFQQRTDPYTQEIHSYAVLKPGFSWSKVWSNIMAYRDASIQAGAMLRRDYPFYGSVNVQDLPMDRRAKMEQETVEKHYDQLIDGAATPNARRNYAGQKTLTLRRWAEQQKIEEAFRQAQEHLAAGGQVIIMAETDKAQSFPVTVKGGTRGQNDKGRDVWRAPGAIERLTAMFTEVGIQVAHIHDTTKYKVAGEVNKFQTGQVPVALATPKSGGAGINLDDVVGTKPRLMLVLSKSLSGDAWDQALGRVSRKTTQSEARVEVLTMPDSYGDQRADDILDKKIRTLRAIQGGEDLDTAAGFEAPPAESKPSDVAGKIADSLENLKSGRKPGDIQAFGIIPAVWDAAVSIAQGIIRSGGKVADAVAAAIAHIKANHKGEWDESGARSALEIASAEEPAATPQGLSDPKDDEVPLATDEWVETQWKGKKLFVRARDHLTPESAATSMDVARNAFEEAGFAPEERTMYDPGDKQTKSFLFLPQTADAEANGQKLVTILARELKDQRAEGKLADHVAALVVSVRENFDMTDSAIGQMTTATRNKLFALAQEEASWRGRALRALANFKADLIRVSRNVDVFLNRIHVTAFDPDGEVARFMRDVGTALSSELSEDDIARLKAKLADPKERPRIIAAIKRAIASAKTKGKIGWKVMRDIERLVESGIINDDEAIAALAKKHGWTIPTDKQKAEMRRLADRRDALLKPSAAELGKAGDDPLALQRLHGDIKGGLREEVLKIEKRLATMWSEFTKPVSLRNAWVQRENNAKFLNELITANILFRASFGTKQAIDITTQWFWRMPMRGLAQALELRHDDITAGRVNVFWKDASKQLADIYADAIKTLRPAVARAVATWTGRAEVRNVERLMSGINALERIRLRAEQLDANGQHGQAFLLKFVGLLRYSFRLASAFDYIHGTPAEWNERRFRVLQALRAQGLPTAVAQEQAQWVMDETRIDYPEALAMTRSMHEARGLESGDEELRESAWNMVERRQFQRMNELSLSADDIEANSVLYRNTLGWNEAEKRGVGSLAGETVSAVGRGFESVGLPLAIGRFGNAIAIGINRTLHRTPLYALANFPFWRGSNRTPSAWHRTKTDQYERRLEAAVGTMFGSAVLGLVIAGLAKVWLKPPPDPEERQLWEKQGHKAGTVEFDLGDGNFSVWSLTTGPMALFAPYAAAGGALNELAVKRDKAQAKLNADAVKRGVTPGTAPGKDLGDWFGVAWKAAQGSILGNRTTSGLLYSSTDYGLPNVQKFAASQIGPLVPGLPALQEISRMSGVIIDPNKGSVVDLLFPLPTSKARKLNMLGDPVGTEDDVQRVIQTLTGGNYPVVSGSAVGGAYRALLSTGFRPPSIDPNRGHLIGGEYRPLTGSELERYTDTRARNLRSELEAIGSTTDPKAAQEAFQRANTAALRSVGVQVTESRAGRASGRPASVQAPSRVSEGDVGTAGSRERVSGRSAYRSRGLSRLSRGKRLRAVRLRGRRLGRFRSPRLRQPKLRGLRRGRLGRRRLSRSSLL